jgi:hypothetical protein
MPSRRTSPEQRARQQLAALSATTRNTIKQLTKDPADRKAAAIIDRHAQQLEQIVTPKQKPLPPPPPSVCCWTCEKWHPRSTPVEWQPPVALQCLCAVGVTIVFLIVFAFVDWWALAVFSIGWLVSLSFLWGVIIPAALLLLVVMVL